MQMKRLKSSWNNRSVWLSNRSLVSPRWLPDTFTPSALPGERGGFSLWPHGYINRFLLHILLVSISVSLSGDGSGRLAGGGVFPPPVWQKNSKNITSLLLLFRFQTADGLSHRCTHTHTRWIVDFKHSIPNTWQFVFYSMFHTCCVSSFRVTRYSIERSSDPDKFFYIEITSGSLMTVRSLDREEIGWHNITILAMEMSTSCTISSNQYISVT